VWPVLNIRPKVHRPIDPYKTSLHGLGLILILCLPILQIHFDRDESTASADSHSTRRFQPLRVPEVDPREGLCQATGSLDGFEQENSSVTSDKVVIQRRKQLGKEEHCSERGKQDREFRVSYSRATRPPSLQDL
jgi:hypothetical protein